MTENLTAERATDADLHAFGWAPGGYLMMRCWTCGQPHTDSDKRSSRCRPCAEKAFIEAKNAPAPTPTASATGMREADLAGRIVTEVAELPDRTSPDDWPDAMIVTADELRAIVEDVLAPFIAELQASAKADVARPERRETQHLAEALYFTSRPDPIEFSDLASYVQDEYRARAAAIRALPASSPAPLPQEVRALVLAARVVMDAGDATPELDRALEAFSAGVLYENEPDASSPVPDGEGVAFFEAVREQVAECANTGVGMWTSCSGCHEGGEYGAGGEPIDPNFGCRLGSGCHECGGIGAFWDTTDYSEKGLAIAEAPARTHTQAEMDAAVSQAAIDVLAERRRQVEAEGRSAEHDDGHAKGEMIAAAANYAVAARLNVVLGAKNFDATPPLEDFGAMLDWPWDVAWWKPGEARRMLVKSAALILAEIERLDRARQPSNGEARS